MRPDVRRHEALRDHVLGLARAVARDGLGHRVQRAGFGLRELDLGAGLALGTLARGLQHGHAEVVTKLLAASADVNKASNDGGTPLYLLKGYLPLAHAELVRHEASFRAAVARVFDEKLYARLSEDAFVAAL